jgi:hypothetical protein
MDPSQPQLTLKERIALHNRLRQSQGQGHVAVKPVGQGEQPESQLKAATLTPPSGPMCVQAPLRCYIYT